MEELSDGDRVHLRGDPSYPPRLGSEFITGKGDTGQDDNDRAVQVRRVDRQPVTGHPIADENRSHVNPRRSHAGERLGNLRDDELDVAL
jgi:hypothetical protein